MAKESELKKGKMKVLSVYRSKIKENRGTPIRVKGILLEMAKYSDIDLSSCSWDESFDEVPNHFYLSNNHLEDLKKIRKHVKENNIDIIMGHTMATFYYLLPLKFLTKAKIVLEMHGFIEEEALMYGSIGKIKYYWQKFIFGLFYRMCDLITTSSDTATEILSKYNRNVFSVFVAADLNLFNPRIKSGGCLVKKEGGIIIGYAGNARIWQGLDFLVEAYNNLKKDHPEFRLAILTSEKKKKFEGDDIQVVGPVSHNKVSCFLIDCDMLVVPRMANEVNRISFPSKLIEYMAMGKPVVASKTSDAHKIITDGVNGLLYNPGDIVGIQKAFLRLKDVDFRNKLGQNAVSLVESRFTLEKQIRVLINKLRDLI